MCVYACIYMCRYSEYEHANRGDVSVCVKETCMDKFMHTCTYNKHVGIHTYMYTYIGQERECGANQGRNFKGLERSWRRGDYLCIC